MSAHPLFRNSAFIMGNANEPPRGPPSLELLEMHVALVTDQDPLMLRAGLKQDPQAVKEYEVFYQFHPEVNLATIPFYRHPLPQ